MLISEKREAPVSMVQFMWTTGMYCTVHVIQGCSFKGNSEPRFQNLPLKPLQALFCDIAEHHKCSFDKNKRFAKDPQLTGLIWTQQSILGN